jgi:hypothetical protein
MGERDLAAETPLTALQRMVTDAVRLPSPLGKGEALASAMAEFVAPSARGMHALERVEVYREQFWLRHLPSLEDDYPTLGWALGSEAFRTLATEYLQAHPPRTWNLQELGADLPGYVARHGLWRGDAIACDAAKLDWSFMEAFDAPDAPPFDARVLTSVPEAAWPGACLAFHPSLRTLVLEHPLHNVRDALKRKHPCERPAAQSTRIVVWRDGACLTRAAPLEPAAFELLTALERGAPLGEACEALARSHPEADSSDLGPRVGAWFQEWTASGWLSALRFGT